MAVWLAYFTRCVMHPTSLRASVLAMSLVAIVCLSLHAPRARAGGFEVPDQSASMGAMGGAGTARHGDASAAFYNPAALADRGGFRGALGLGLAIPTITAESTETMERASTTTSVSPPPHLHLSYAENEWAIGAYIGASHGTGVHWPQGWWGMFETQSTSLFVVRVAPFFSWRFGGGEGQPDIRVSIGAHVDTARLETSRRLDMIDFVGNVHVLLAGAGVGGDASVYWQALPELSVGLTYKSRTWMRLNGDADFTVPDAFVGRAPDQRASAELVIPDRLALGVAWQTPEFAIYGDVQLTLWSVRRSTDLDFESQRTTDVSQPNRWSDTATFRLGGEYSPLPELLHLRIGGFYDMAAAPDDTLAPSAPDMARVGFGGGVGVDFTREIGIDAYYTYVGFVGRTSTSDDAPLARYSGDIHLIGLTARLTVGAAEPAVEEEGAETGTGTSSGSGTESGSGSESGSGAGSESGSGTETATGAETASGSGASESAADAPERAESTEAEGATETQRRRDTTGARRHRLPR